MAALPASWMLSESCGPHVWSLIYRNPYYGDSRLGQKAGFCCGGFALRRDLI